MPTCDPPHIQAAVPGIRQLMCDVQLLLRNSTDFLVGIDSYMGSLQSLTEAAENGTTAMADHLSCLESTFTTGAVGTACADLITARESANDVEALVASVGGATAASRSAQWVSLKAYLDATLTLTCVTLMGYSSPVADSLAAVRQLVGPLSTGDELASLESSFGVLVDDVRSCRQNSTACSPITRRGHCC